MSTSFTRRLLKAVEADLQTSKQSDTVDNGKQTSSTNNKSKSNNKKKRRSEEAIAGSSLTEDDIMNWHIRSIQHIDSNILGKATKSQQVNLFSKKKPMKPYAKEQLATIIKQQTKQSKQQSKLKQKNATSGSCRTAPTQSTIHHPSTFNKQLYQRTKMEKERTKLAEKLKLLEKLKKKEKATKIKMSQLPSK